MSNGISETMTSPPLIVRTQKRTRILSDVTAVEYGALDQSLARICPTDLLEDAPCWALVVWCRPHVNDIGVTTVGQLSPGATVPHVQSPARRCNVVGTFFNEESALDGLERATRVIQNILVFGTPATNQDHASVSVDIDAIRTNFTLDLRDLMNGGREEHRRRLHASMDAALGNREPRVIDLDGEGGDPAPVAFPETFDTAGISEAIQGLENDLLSGMGVPEEILTPQAGVRAAQEELARRSVMSNPPRDARERR